MLKKIKFYSIFISIITLVILIVAALICLFIKQQTLTAYSNILFYTGGIFLLIGLMSYIGTARKTRDTTYRIARTTLSVPKEDLFKEDLTFNNKSMEFLTVASCIGVILIIISGLVLKLR